MNKAAFEKTVCVCVCVCLRERERKNIGGIGNTEYY